jgi:hypothetical protein
MNWFVTMSPGIQIYVHQQTAHNVTRYTDICTSTNCSQCHQVYRYMYINKLLTLVTLWAVCWFTYICIPCDIVSSLLMYIYLYTWWHCEQFVDVHISVYLVTLWAVFALISQNYKITLQILKVHFSMNNLSLYIIIELLTIVQIPG